MALAAPTASITDVDSTTLTQLVLTIVDGLSSGDVLAANTAGSNITANFANGTLVLSGSDTVAHYQQVLRSVAFDTATITSGSRTVEVLPMTTARSKATRLWPRSISTCKLLS